jgi:hypothetical protein
MSHLRIRRMMRWSPIRCSTNRMSHLVDRLLPAHPRPLAVDLLSEHGGGQTKAGPELWVRSAKSLD